MVFLCSFYSLDSVFFSNCFYIFPANFYFFFQSTSISLLFEKNSNCGDLSYKDFILIKRFFSKFFFFKFFQIFSNFFKIFKFCKFFKISKRGFIYLFNLSVIFNGRNISIWGYFIQWIFQFNFKYGYQFQISSNFNLYGNFCMELFVWKTIFV